MSFVYNSEQLKKLYAVISLLLLGAGGYAVTDHSQPYSPYSDRVGQIDSMMQALILNPTPEACHAAYQELSLQGDWAYRQTGTQKNAYENYLEACNDVQIALKNGSPDLNKKIEMMETAKAALY